MGQYAQTLPRLPLSTLLLGLRLRPGGRRSCPGADRRRAGPQRPNVFRRHGARGPRPDPLRGCGRRGLQHRQPADRGRHRRGWPGRGFPGGHRLGADRGRDFKLPDQSGRQSPAAFWRSRAGDRGHCARCRSLSAARGLGDGHQHTWHRTQPGGRHADGLLVSDHDARPGQRHKARPRALHHCPVLCHWRAALHGARQPAADGQASRRQDARQRLRLLEGSGGLAPGRPLWRRGLVPRDGVELRGLGGAPGEACWSRRFLLYRPGRNHGIGLLGRFCVA